MCRKCGELPFTVRTDEQDRLAWGRALDLVVSRLNSEWCYLRGIVALLVAYQLSRIFSSLFSNQLSLVPTPVWLIILWSYQYLSCRKQLQI